MKPTPENLIALLRGHPFGMDGGECALALFGHASESAKRQVRALASEAAPFVVAAPNCGYKHFEHATDDDLLHAARAIRSQTSKMNRRAESYECALSNRRNFQLQLG